jgi:hypothetical protein
MPRDDYEARMQGIGDQIAKAQGELGFSLFVTNPKAPGGAPVWAPRRDRGRRLSISWNQGFFGRSAADSTFATDGYRWPA